MSLDQHTEPGVALWFPLEPRPSLSGEIGAEYFAPENTLGLSAVKHENTSTEYLLAAGQIEDELAQHVAAREWIQDKYTPREGFLRYQLGKVARRSAQMADLAAVSDPFRQPERLQEAIGDYATAYARSAADKLHGLGEVRAQLQSLTQAEQTELDGYMLRNAPDFLFHAKKQVIDGDDGWSRWLSDEATNEQLMNVLQWHTFMTGEQASSAIMQERVEQKKREFKEVVPLLVGAGVLSPLALEAVNAINAVEVTVGDAFSTTVKGWGGYHLTGTPFIVVQHGSGGVHHERQRNLLENVDNVTFHEFTHATLARAYDAGNEVMSVRWLNEALTERIAQLMKAFNPHEDYTLSGVYAEENKLLRVLTEREDGFIEPKVAMRAYSGDEQDCRRFSEAVDTLWGETDVLKKVNDIVAYGEAKGDRLSQERALNFVAQQLRLHPALVIGN